MKHLILTALVLFASLFTSLSNAYDRVTYIHSDGQGSPIAASDEQGNLEWRAEYYPFGAEFTQTEIRRENNISFSGKPLDQEIGLSYFGARHYDPLIGRFTSMDPVQVDPDDYRTFNRYAYANNNPYKYVDPNGELPFLIPVVIFIGREIAAELASRATGGATDFLSLRRGGTKLFKKAFTLSKSSGKGVDPKKIRFTQDSVGNTIGTPNGPRPLRKLVKNLTGGRTSADDIPPIRVFNKSGNLTTLDNRRLKAFQVANKPINTVPATASEIANDAFKFTSKNRGTSVRIRNGGL